jgi:hypothetical protein
MAAKVVCFGATCFFSLSGFQQALQHFFPRAFFKKVYI